jgi:hypothetical protein
MPTDSLGLRSNRHACPRVAEYGNPGLWDAIPLGLLPGSRFTTDYGPRTTDYRLLTTSLLLFGAAAVFCGNDLVEARLLIG